MGTVNQEDQLTRIVDDLESISSNLADVAEMLEDINKNLDNCISITNRGSFLCITGDVSTH